MHRREDMIVFTDDPIKIKKYKEMNKQDFENDTVIGGEWNQYESVWNDDLINDND